jgi:[NiFe] hydrogenase diaphorase moiety small subunit
VESDTEQLKEYRRSLVEMLFSEGNHFCMFCEKSGNCELQALGYRFGVMASRHAYFWPDRELDASHPDIFFDHNRCIQCGRCVQVSKDLDGKNVFQFINRGLDRRVGIDAGTRLKDTNLDVTDKAVEVCPVGAIVKKRTGFRKAVGTRKYDHKPIGHQIEEKQVAVKAE